MALLSPMVTRLNNHMPVALSVNKMTYFGSVTGPCDVDAECPQGRVRYYIKSGYQNVQPPRICFNGKE